MLAVFKGILAPDGAVLFLLLVLPPVPPLVQVHMLKLKCVVVLSLLPCCMLKPMLQGLQGGSIGLAC